MVRSTTDRLIRDECDNNSLEHLDCSTLADLRASPGRLAKLFHCAKNASGGNHRVAGQVQILGRYNGHGNNLIRKKVTNVRKYIKDETTNT